jgi:hypothetical protein
MLARRRDDDAIHLLLARGRLSGAARERILARVLGALAAARAPWRRLAPRAAAWASAAAAAGAAVVLLLARAPSPSSLPSPAPMPLAARGAAGAPFVQARCAGRPPAQCRRGDRLLFEVDGAEGGGLLAAYAEPAAGERIWYFPTVTGHLGAIPAGAGHVVVPEAARLGDEHAPGRYTLHLLVLDGPATRAELVAGRAPARAAVAVPIEVLP